MKTKIPFFTIAWLIASLFCFASCSMGKGDRRDRNLEQVVLSRLDSITHVEYVGMSDVRRFADNKLQAVVIYYVTDSIGNKIECNARVTTDDDCSELYTWEDLDSKIFGDVRQMVSDKLEEKGINVENSLIDALIELKRR